MSVQSKFFSNPNVLGHTLNFLRGSQPAAETILADHGALAACARVSRTWNQVVQNLQNTLWTNVGPRLFPSIEKNDNYGRECRARAALIQANLQEVQGGNFLERRTPLEGIPERAAFLDKGPAHFFAALKDKTCEVWDILTRRIAHTFDAQKFQGRLSTLPLSVMAEGKFVILGKNLQNQYCFLVWDLEKPDACRDQPLPGLHLPVFGAVGDKIIFAERESVESFSVFSLRQETIRSYPLSSEFGSFAPRWRGVHRIGGLNDLIFLASEANMTELFDLAVGQSRGVRPCFYDEVLQMGNSALVRTKEYYWDVHHDPDLLNRYNHRVQLTDLDFASNRTIAEHRLSDRLAFLLFPFCDQVLHVSLGNLGRIYCSSSSFTRAVSHAFFRLSLKYERAGFADFVRFCDGKLHILALIDARPTLVTCDFSTPVPAPVEEAAPPPAVAVAPPTPAPVAAAAPLVGDAVQTSGCCAIL